ncbi:hypothetical protein, partial [Nocardia farcinica]|uniref:hypothetical protein n=1 Tax=Nocardia farcinica TaxID=37329 RepID=UPI0022B9D73B
ELDVEAELVVVHFRTSLGVSWANRPAEFSTTGHARRHDRPNLRLGAVVAEHTYEHHRHRKPEIQDVARAGDDQFGGSW